MALEATVLLTQDSDPGGPTLIDACNGLNELIRLEMLWLVRHRCPAGRGSRSISTGIGRSFSSATLVMHR